MAIATAMKRCLSSDNRGFAYLTVIFMAAVIGITLGMAGQVWSTASTRAKEEELIFRGDQIRKAVGRYYEESPGAKAYPKSLEELVNDKRWPVTKRHLRKIYIDPMTGKADWESIKAPDGGIMGVRSKSTKAPYKKKNFPTGLTGFEGKMNYSGWDFVYIQATATN